MTGLDPSALALLASAAPGRPFEDGTVAEARAAYTASWQAARGPLAPLAESRTLWHDSLRLRLWRGGTAPATGARALLYLHGGGWVIGSPESHEDICRTLAHSAGAVVISPDYRLAPEHPFPAALEDGAAALRWMVDQAGNLGIDHTRLAVGGDSAGGNLAAVLALMARDGVLPPLAAQLLFYPNTDAGQTHDSYRRFASGHGLTARTMRWFRDLYLTHPSQAADWRISPLRAPSLKGVAPAFVALAGHDILHDEGAAYAARLQGESRAEVQTWPGQLHGFVSQGARIPEAAEACAAAAAAWLRFDQG